MLRHFRIRCCLALAVISLAAWPLQAGKFNRALDPGDPAPVFQNLVGIDGKQHSLADYSAAEAVVLVVICNQCPCVKSYQPRIVELAKDYAERNVQVLAVNVNLTEADGLARMQQQAKEGGFTFPYLFDPTQDIGRAYGARATPTAYVLDRQRKVAYLGAVDDNREADLVEKRYLREALDAVLAGKQPVYTETRPVGCAIFYEEGDE